LEGTEDGLVVWCGMSVSEMNNRELYHKTKFSIKEDITHLWLSFSHFCYLLKVMKITELAQNEYSNNY
jgi:hypothetical protein